MRIIATMTAVLLGAGAFMWGSAAHAQERSWFQQTLRPASNAFELKVGTGYTQGFGMLTPSQSVQDVAGAGLGFSLDADYRVNPRWSFGAQGEYQEFSPNIGTAVRGLAANLGFTFHGSPETRGDPWMRIGAGYRGFMDVNPPDQPTKAIHGLELAKLSLGYDVRVSPGVAIAPVIGADLDLFAWQYQNGVNSALASPRVGTFVFAGLQGRFDTATRAPSSRYAARAPRP